MKLAKAIVSLTFTLVLIILLNQRIGSIPPLGKFLDPISGFWQNAELAYPSGEENISIHGLKEPVRIIFDDRGVPHIFAENDHDLYLAQGFITARDRLWQMEFQTHAAGGRISEIVGKAGIEFDRFHRRIGMGYGARNVLKAMQANEQTWASVTAYSDGVNAYINSLGKSELPIEYKILDYEPELWSPIKTGLMVMNLANTLTGSSDLEMTNTLDKLGPDLTKKLFPHDAPYFNPVLPEDTGWDFEPKQAQQPDPGFVPQVMENAYHLEQEPGIGSNNWAVDGSKTESGSPMLANDPHLNLTLPSLWYEVQLHSPTVNVYGASLPGAPAVIIGHNENIAWGVTNTGADVMDIYEIEFQSESKEKYLHDGEWKQAYSEIEEIKVRDGESVLDTIIYTHHGPITLKEGEEPFQDFTPPEHAIRWLAHDESNEILTFLKINRARNYQEFVDGIKHHEVPAQTYAYADVGGNIALWSNGLFPLKWHGQGDFINDGRDPLYDWQGWIPHEQNPHHENPASGYVGSANQPQVGPDYPYYLGRHFSPNERAIRLDELLNEASGIDKEYMRQMQNDNLNVHARTILPFLLERIDKGSLDNHQQEIISELNVWDYKMDPESRSATVFHFWWRELYRSMWETLYGNQENVLKYPARDHTVYLMISEPDSELFTHESNGYTLSLNDFIKDSFVYVEGDLVQEHGEFGDSWNWGQAQGANIGHVASIPGFDSGHLLTGGDDGVLNAVRRGDNGPSWRMVVDLDQTVQGYGIYPGGQSGNPGSKHYDQFVDDWVEGELYELLFLESPDEKHPSIRYSLTMTTN